MSNIKEIKRYVDRGNDGEYIHLKGYPCINSKCTFCIFPKDNSLDTTSSLEYNKELIDRVHGNSKILEVYNFGSIFEVPFPSLLYLSQKVQSKGIERLITDSHWFYRESFDQFRNFIPCDDVMIKIGLETFDNEVREKLMKKGMGYVTIDDILKYTNAINLLVGFKGQTREQILDDIDIVSKKFRFADVNIIDPNFTPRECVDLDLVEWFLANFQELPDKFRINYEVS